MKKEPISWILSIIVLSVSGCSVITDLFITNRSAHPIHVKYQVTGYPSSNGGFLAHDWTPKPVVLTTDSSLDDEDLADDIAAQVKTMKPERYSQGPYKNEVIEVHDIILNPSQSLYFLRSLHFSNYFTLLSSMKMVITSGDSVLYDTEYIAKQFSSMPFEKVNCQFWIIPCGYAENLIVR